MNKLNLMKQIGVTFLCNFINFLTQILNTRGNWPLKPIFTITFWLKGQGLTSSTDDYFICRMTTTPNDVGNEYDRIQAIWKHDNYFSIY